MRLCRAAFSRSILAIATTLSAALATPALAQFAPGFQTFQAPEGLAWAPAMLSDDGTTVSGNVFIPRTNIINGFTLTPTTYTQFSETGEVFDISNGGMYTTLYNGRRASDGTIEVLDPSVVQPIGEGVGSSISRDGRTIAASNQIQPPGSSPTSNRAYRWTEGFGVTVLPQYRPGAAFTEARDISGDGQIIVGSGRESTFSGREAWVWTEASGITILPDVPGGRFMDYEALATNNDGSIIVGQGSAPEPFDRGIKWVNGVATPLPAPAGYRDVSAFDLTDDGSIIVGQIGGSLTGLPRTDAVWTDAAGWVPIFEYLRSRGVDVPLSYSSQNADVSADGLTFAGTATDSITGQRVVFVAVIPSPSSLAALALLCGLRRRTRAAADAV